MTRPFLIARLRPPGIALLAIGTMLPYGVRAGAVHVRPAPKTRRSPNIGSLAGSNTADVKRWRYGSAAER